MIHMQMPLNILQGKQYKMNFLAYKNCRDQISKFISKIIKQKVPVIFA